MKISEIKIGSIKEVEGVVSNKSKAKAVEISGKQSINQKATLSDDTGKISITLWDDDVNIAEGSKIKIENGYVKDYKGTLELSAGKFGKIIVVEESDKEDAKAFMPEQNKSLDFVKASQFKPVIDSKKIMEEALLKTQDIYDSDMLKPEFKKLLEADLSKIAISFFIEDCKKNRGN